MASDPISQPANPCCNHVLRAQRSTKSQPRRDGTTRHFQQRVIDRHSPLPVERCDNEKSTLISLSISVSIAGLAAGVAISAQDKYTVQVPNGLGFSEFRGYEDWPVIAISENGGKIAVIVGSGNDRRL